MLRICRKAFFAIFAPVVHFYSKTWMRLWGCTVPRSARINGCPYLWMNNGEIVLGERVVLSSIPFIHEAGQEFHRCSLSASAGAHIHIDDDSCIIGSAIVARKSVDIGKRVMIAAGCRIFDTNFHPVDTVPRRYAPEPEPVPVIIEDDVWLANEVIILPGVRIGHGSVIGARSVVTGNIPPLVFAAGIPARVIRPLDVSAV